MSFQPINSPFFHGGNHIYFVYILIRLSLFLLNSRSLGYILDISSLSDICMANIFCQSVAYLYTYWIPSFDKKCSILIMYILIIFFVIMSWLFMSWEIFVYLKVLEILFSVFFWKLYTISFYVWFLVHLKLNFLYEVRHETKFFLHITSLLSQHHLLKTPLSPLE